MIVEATDVGNLIADFPTNHPLQGRVSRVFRNSTYVVAGEDVFLLLRGRLRSPMTVNLSTDTSLDSLLSVGELCGILHGRMEFNKITVRTRGVRIFRNSLESAVVASPVDTSSLVEGAVALRLLYGVSDPGLAIVFTRPFRRFVDSVLVPASGGTLTGAYVLNNYLPLIGTGGGFTPAGDDLVGGFAATFNLMARVRGMPEIRIPREELQKRTVPESAALLDYAQRGFVDEEVERLILSAFGGRKGGRFFQGLLELAKRGHTSGIDVSMGVLLAAAMIRDMEAADGALARCLEAIGIGDLGIL
jgi:hypothetical protein